MGAACSTGLWGRGIRRIRGYHFTNTSADIRRIFTDACDAIGVQWRNNNATNISIARRASVAILDSFVGPKQ